MTLTFNEKVMVLGKNVRDSQDGKSKYYNLAIYQNGQAGNVSCTEEVYKWAKEMTEMNLTFVYNEQYNSMRITAAGFPVPDGHPSDKTKADAAK